jgi:hypothetical protein
VAASPTWNVFLHRCRSHRARGAAIHDTLPGAEGEIYALIHHPGSKISTAGFTRCPAGAHDELLCLMREKIGTDEVKTVTGGERTRYGERISG